MECRETGLAACSVRKQQGLEAQSIELTFIVEIHCQLNLSENIFVDTVRFISIVTLKPIKLTRKTRHHQNKENTFNLL